MRRFCGLVGLAAVVLLAPGAQRSEAVTITSIVGDLDCFGLGGACADGSALAFALPNPGQGPGLMDTGNSGGSDAWTHFYAPIAGTVVSATLTIRVYDLGTIGGADTVGFNGTTVLTRPDDSLLNFDRVRTLVIPIPIAFLGYDGSEDVQFTPSTFEYWAVDYSKLDIEVNAVPEPGTMLLLGSGLAGIALRRRRRNDS